MIQYIQWYRAMGVRQSPGFTSPELRPLSELYFPLNSAIHMLSAVGVGEDDTVDHHVILGPAVEDPILSHHHDHLLVVRPVVQYVNKDIAGKPITKVNNLTAMIAKYIGSNSRILKLSPTQAAANTQTNLLI